VKSHLAAGGPGFSEINAEFLFYSLERENRKIFLLFYSCIFYLYYGIREIGDTAEQIRCRFMCPETDSE